MENITMGVVLLLSICMTTIAVMNTIQVNEEFQKANNTLSEMKEIYAPVIRLVETTQFITERNYSEDYNCFNFSRDFFEVAKAEGFDVKITHGYAGSVDKYLETGIGHGYNTVCFDYESQTGRFINYDDYHFLYYFNESERGSWNGTSLIEMMRGEGG